MVSESPILVFQCLTRGASSLLNANNGRNGCFGSRVVKDQLTGVNTQVHLLDRVFLKFWSVEKRNNTCRLIAR